jgi:hypothetical protein
MMLLPTTASRGVFEAHPTMKGSSLMKIAIDGYSQSTARAGGGAHSRIVSGAVALFAFAVFAATPSFCHAQVTGLGSAASYGLLEDGGSVNVNGLPSFNSVKGNIGLQSATVNVGLLNSLSVSGTAYEGSGVTINAKGFLHGQGNFSANSTATGPQTPLALAAAFTAATSASSSDKALAFTTTISSNNVITGTQAVNVVNVSSISHDLTISGSANQVFVINVTGSGGINLSNVRLSGSVTAKDVLFNITGKGNVSLGGGTVNGTFLDTGSGSISLNRTTVNGEIIAGSGGVTITNSAAINGEPFAGGAAVAAPELPSIAMAGAACLLLLGRAAVARFKRSRAT